MRRYYVGFLERVGATEPSNPGAPRRHLFRHGGYSMHDYFFGEALGEFRSGFGTQLAIVAAGFNLDVEDNLAAILPPPGCAS